MISQGASLVVIYRDNTLPRTTIIINDGAVALNALRPNHTNTINGFDASSPVGYAQVTYLVGDGQSNWDDESIFLMALHWQKVYFPVSMATFGVRIHLM